MPVDDDYLSDHLIIKNHAIDAPKSKVDKEKKKSVNDYDASKLEDQIDWLGHDLATGNLITSIPKQDFIANHSYYNAAGHVDTSNMVAAEPFSQLPVIDIDVPCELLPSSRPGHFHLLIYKRVTRTFYSDILRALIKAGIVEEGFYQSFLRRGYTAIRTPTSMKPGVPLIGEQLLKSNAQLSHENAVLTEKVRRLEEELAKRDLGLATV